MPKARIYRPDKSAMQSGKKTMASWVLEFVPEKPFFIENLMGWTGMTDMPQQTRLHFPSREAALAYAQRQQLDFEVLEPHRRSLVRKAYADNFTAPRPLDPTRRP